MLVYGRKFCIFVLLMGSGSPLVAKVHSWDKLKIGEDYLSDEVVVEIFQTEKSRRYEMEAKTWSEKTKRGLESPEAKELLHLSTELGCKLVKKLGTLPFFEFKIPKSSNPTALCEAFEAHGDLVKLAEPNGLLKACYTPYSFPNDPYYQDGGSLWNIAITQLDKAWNTSTGGMNTWSQGNPPSGLNNLTALQAGQNFVLIAIVDSGVNTTHEDLMSQLVGGYNVLDGSTDVTDTLGHGTEVASIASVDTNNGIGIAGGAIAERILPIKIADSSPYSASDAATGVNWAASLGASVISMSFGGGAAWAPEQAACDDAYNNYGVFLVASAGNTGTEVINYPAGYSNVVAAAGTTSADQWWNGSSYGSNISFGAPSSGVFCEIGSNSAYGGGQGTSAAAPAIGALAGILMSNEVAFYECVSRIAATCDKIDSATNAYSTMAGYPLGTWNEYLGYGRINYYRAMCTLVPPTLDSANSSLGQVSLNFTAPALSDAGIAGYDIYRATSSGGPYTQINSSLVSSTSFNDVSVSSGQTWFYVVKGVDNNPEAFLTKPSNELSASVPYPSPTITPTFSISPTFSITATITQTFTPSPTPTITPTFSDTAPVPTPPPGVSGYLYPQPAPGPNLILVYSLDQAGLATAYIYNQIGTLVTKQTANGQAIANNQMTINIDGWGWGIYYLVIEANGNRRSAIKFAIGK